MGIIALHRERESGLAPGATHGRGNAVKEIAGRTTLEISLRVTRARRTWADARYRPRHAEPSRTSGSARRPKLEWHQIAIYAVIRASKLRCLRAGHRWAPPSQSLYLLASISLEMAAEAVRCDLPGDRCVRCDHRWMPSGFDRDLPAGPADVERAAAAIRALLDQREQGKTICPSDAARSLGGEDFRDYMTLVREASWALVSRGELEVLQHGKRVDLDAAHGPVRLRFAQDASQVQ